MIYTACMPQQTIGQRLRALRLKARLTQKEAGLLVRPRIHHVQISRYEADIFEPRASTYARLESALLRFIAANKHRAVLPINRKGPQPRKAKT